MAYRPSYRRHVKMENLEPNLTPIMNLMTVLIPILLSQAQFLKIGILELNLPPAVGASVAAHNTPRETQRLLDLSVSVTDKGFYISSAMAVLRSADDSGPSVPKLPDGKYNYAELSQKLYEIKKKAADFFPDTDSIVIQAEPQVSYQVLVHTMDASRDVKVNGQHVDLFPVVALSAGII